LASGALALQCGNGMAPFISLLASVIAWMASAGSASGAGANDPDSQCKGLDKKVVALISQYRELRERRRHLPEGAYDKDLRDHGGKLHRVLQSLGMELGHPPSTRKIIVECIGEPDAIWNDVQIARFLGVYERERRKAGRELKAKRDREYLVYYWRGGHDFMFFINEGGLIVDHGWWFAYE
jgi:hypothetical protein